MLCPLIPYPRLQFTLQVEEPAWMLLFQGSMLRGAFGHALRRTISISPGSAFRSSLECAAA
jgi:hypothetical protein